MTSESIEKESILVQTPDSLHQWMEEQGQKKFRTKQLLTWLFEDRKFTIDSMSNLPKDLRTKLCEHFNWSLPEVLSKLDSEDGATKLLLKSSNNQQYEAVILRYEGRTSLCVSSQVGCKLSCSFCQTGKLGFFRNLTAGEILGQFALAQEIVAQEGRNITHIVFMGMGEPLDNFEHVTRAVNQLTSTSGFGISPRRVTISTSGIVPKIELLPSKVKASLAISLHACRDELRSELMPINRKYPLAKLKDSLLHYQEQTGQTITIEYILIGQKNCGKKEAKELVSFLHGLKAKVNLIPFNSHPGLEYERPNAEEIRSFQEYLSRRGYPSPVRYSKGLEVSAACGQLAAKYQENLNASPQRKNVISISP